MDDRQQTTYSLRASQRAMPKYARLKEHIIAEVRAGRLGPGDALPTELQLAAHLKIARSTVRQALGRLDSDGFIRRIRGKGTFIHQDAQRRLSHGEALVPSLQTVHILGGLPRDGDGWAFPIGEIVQGLHDVMPGFQVQSNVLPRNDSVELVRQIVEQRTADGSLAGILLVSCPRKVQELVLEFRLPAISLGSVYSSADLLPSIDHDQFEVGRLQAEYLLKRGHRRIMLLMRDTWRSGDNRLAAGVNKAMGDAGLAIGSLITRSIPEEKTLIEREIHRLLRIDNRPTGLICRFPKVAGIAVETVRSHSMSVPEDLDIVFSHEDKVAAEGLNLPQVCSQITYREQAKLGAQTLDELIRGKQPENRHVLLPVELVEAS